MSRLLRVRVRHNELVVSGLTTMLAPYADRVRVLPPGGEDSSVLGEQVDLVVCDAASAVPDAARSLDHLRRAWRADRIVVFGWSSTGTEIGDALAAGADGYVALELTADQLVRVLERVAEGEVVVTGRPTRVDDAALPRLEEWPGRESGLTLRESQVIGHVAEGLSNERVAEEVFLSVNTVKVHLRTAYRTMGVRSRTQAVLWAIDHGFRVGT